MAFDMSVDAPSSQEMQQGKLLSAGSGIMKATFGPDPDLSQFTRLRTNTFRQYFEALKEDDNYYRLKYGESAIPQEWQQKGFKPTTPPTAYNAVEAATDHILTAPDIFIPPRPYTANFITEQELASSKMRFLESWWHNLIVHGDPVTQATKKVIKDGKLILKKEIDWDAIDKKGKDVGTRKFIWRVRCLPADSVMEDPDNPYDPMYAYESYQIRVDEAKRLFPQLPDAQITAWRGKKPDDRVQYIEYWRKPLGKDQGARKVWIDTEKVIDKPNPYRWKDFQGNYDGYIPYHIRDSGWGDVDSNAMPHDRYVGILRYMHSMLETEARQLSAADAQLRITTFPVILMYGINEDKEKQVRIGPAAKVHLADKNTQSIETLKFPTLDPSVWQILTRLHTYANELAKFEQLSGSPQRGVDTATEADQNFRNASAKLRGPVMALQTMMMAVNEQILQDIEHLIEAPVTVYGASESGPGIVVITPVDIDGFYTNFVELTTTDQANLDRADARLWGDMYRILRLDRAYAGTKAGIKNMQERITARAAEDVFDDPRSHELRVMMALDGQGEMGQQIQQAMMQSIQGGQGPLMGGGGGGGQGGNGQAPGGAAANPTPQPAATGAAGPAPMVNPDSPAAGFTPGSAIVRAGYAPGDMEALRAQALLKAFGQRPDLLSQ